MFEINPNPELKFQLLMIRIYFVDKISVRKRVKVGFIVRIVFLHVLHVCAADDSQHGSDRVVTHFEPQCA